MAKELSIEQSRMKCQNCACDIDNCKECCLGRHLMFDCFGIKIKTHTEAEEKRRMTIEESSLSDEKKMLEKYELRLNPIRVSVELDGTESGIELAKEKFRTELEPLLRIVHVNELPYDIVEILEDGSERTMWADLEI